MAKRIIFIKCTLYRYIFNINSLRCAYLKEFLEGTRAVTEVLDLFMCYIYHSSSPYPTTE